MVIFFAAKDGEALYSKQKQDQELTVAQIKNSWDWGQEEKGTTEDEMVGWHHRPYGHEFG